MDAHEQSSTPPSSDHSARIEVRHEGQVVASAEVRSTPEPHGTARVGLQRHRDDAPPEARVHLVDQVMDEPGVSNSDSVHVVLPLGDSASISRLQERTVGFTARAAGASSVVDAQVPRGVDEAGGASRQPE